MGPQEKLKLTKQGVRDLNHLPPKRPPVPIEAAETVDEELPPVAPQAVVPDGAATFPIEP
jgi:hypothetical protein